MCHNPCGVQGWLIPQLSHQNCAAVLLRSKHQEKPLLVVLLYFDANTNSFVEDLDTCSDYARQHHALLLLGMDSNSYSTIWGCPESDKRGEGIKNWLFINGLQLHNDGVEDTFVTSRAASKIDLMVSLLTTSPFVTEWRVKTNEQISDHR